MERSFFQVKQRKIKTKIKKNKTKQLNTWHFGHNQLSFPINRSFAGTLTQWPVQKACRWMTDLMFPYTFPFRFLVDNRLSKLACQATKLFIRTNICINKKFSLRRQIFLFSNRVIHCNVINCQLKLTKKKMKYYESQKIKVFEARKFNQLPF